MKNFLSGSKMFRFVMMFLVPVVFLLHPWVAFPEEPVENPVAKEDELDDELKYLKEETYVITPSKIPQRIEKAPGTIHVITEKQIRQMGARYLSEVVQTVPGWFVEQWFYGQTMFFVRGAAGTLSSRILFMMNSHQVNNVSLGTGIFSYANLDLENVKRIEFVNGPGSALYGSGAESGIINIITKEGEDIDGLQVMARGGSFDSWDGSALFGKNINGLEVAAYANYRSTEGYQGFVDQDQQSVLDQQYGTHASLAPGNMKGDLYQWDAQLTMKWKGFKFDGKYIDKKRDDPFGFRPILDNTSNFTDKDYYLNLSYDVTPTEGLDLMVKAYRNQQKTGEHAQMFPKGSIMMTPRGPMITQENRYYEAGGKNSRMGAEAQINYEIVDSNTIVGGITFEKQKFYDTYRNANYQPTASPYVNIPLPSVQNFDDYFPEKERNVYAAYLEDIWDILEDLRLTIGGRYDHYSESGGQFSPRLGVNWEFAENYNTKFEYGKAFRAPNFFELYQPQYGNADLKNQTSETLELTFGTDFHPFSGQITPFWSRSKDSIFLSQDSSGGFPRYKWINSDPTKRIGVELQMKYDFGRGTYLGVNYTQFSMDMGDTDADIWMEPTRLGTLTGNVRLNKYLNLNAQLLYRGGWHREQGDPRENMSDYVTANATLIARNFLAELKGLEFRGAVYNLFNKDYTAPTAAGELPGDMPLPGINFMLELRYAF
jgi:outer membrane cobalamin receptor